jgi:hypothetical protein
MLITEEEALSALMPGLILTGLNCWLIYPNLRAIRDDSSMARRVITQLKIQALMEILE